MSLKIKYKEDYAGAPFTKREFVNAIQIIANNIKDIFKLPAETDEAKRAIIAYVHSVEHLQYSPLFDPIVSCFILWLFPTLTIKVDEISPISRLGDSRLKIIDLEKVSKNQIETYIDLENDEAFCLWYHNILISNMSEAERKVRKVLSVYEGEEFVVKWFKTQGFE